MCRARQRGRNEEGECIFNSTLVLKPCNIFLCNALIIKIHSNSICRIDYEAAINLVPGVYICNRIVQCWMNDMYCTFLCIVSIRHETIRKKKIYVAIIHGGEIKWKHPFLFYRLPLTLPVLALLNHMPQMLNMQMGR